MRAVSAGSATASKTVEAALKGKHRDVRGQLFATGLLLMLLLSLALLVVLVVSVLIDAWPTLSSRGVSFLTSNVSSFPEKAGVRQGIVGSIILIMFVALLAVPIGVAAAIYLEEYAPKNWFSAIIEINVTNLAGVPSIVYGLLALGLFVYQFDLGQSIAAAGLTLALLILPIVIVATRESIRSVPNAIREAAYGLGATRWEVTKDHVLPYSTGGILTGMILGLSRAIGETAPIITIGALSFIAFLPQSPIQSEFPFISFAWLKDPFTAMPIQMFNWVSRPDQAFQANAAAAGAILLGMTLIMNGLAIWIRYRFRKKINW